MRRLNIDPKTWWTAARNGLPLAWPAMSIRQLLAALVLGTAVPLVTLAFVMFQQLVAHERQGVRDGLMSSARSFGALVDNEIDMHVAVAATLATSSALESGDLVTFRTQSERAVAAIPGAWINLVDPAGHVLMTTLPVALPTQRVGKIKFEAMAKAFATGKPQVSDIEAGLVTKFSYAVVTYPIYKAGAPRYSLWVVLHPDRFQGLIRAKLGEKTVVGIIDRQRRFIARVPAPEASLGALASPGWRAALDRNPEGIAEYPTIEGTPSLQASVTTRDGWAVGVAYPTEVLEAPVRSIRWSMGVLGLTMTLASFALALGLGRRMSGAMSGLVTAAQRVGRGDIVAPEAFPIHEATAISQAFSAASAERNQAEERLRASEEFARTVLEASPDCLKVIGADGRLNFVNQNGACLLELDDPSAVVGQLWESLWPDASRPKIRQSIEAASAGQLIKFTAEAPTAKGKPKIWDVTVAPILNTVGKPVKFIASSRDVTEAKTAEAELRESEVRFRQTFENTAVGVAHVGLDGRWLEVNQTLCDFLGYSREELQTKTFQDITHPDDLNADPDHLHRLMADEIQKYGMDKRYIRKDGSSTWCGLTVALRRDTAGAPLYFIAIVRDITERKQAQDHLQFLLHEIAHRSKNQLAVIQSMERQTARSATSLADFQQRFEERIQGLAVSIDMLVAENWTGAALGELVRRQLEVIEAGDTRLECEGPDVTVGADAAQAIGLALHELATNSVKHGAWSAPAGIVTVSWLLERNGSETPRLRLRWQERGGPVVTPPTRKGFGHMVIDNMIAQKLDAVVDMAFDPQGLCWTVTIPSTNWADNSSGGRGGQIRHMARQ